MFNVICDKKCTGCPVGKGNDSEGVPRVTKLLWNGSHLPEGLTFEEHKANVISKCSHCTGNPTKNGGAN